MSYSCYLSSSFGALFFHLLLGISESISCTRIFLGFGAHQISRKAISKAPQMLATPFIISQVVILSYQPNAL